MSERIPGFGKRMLDLAFGLSDSIYPVIYCNENLTIVDQNKAAIPLDFDIERENAEKYLSSEDAKNIKAMLYSKKCAPDEDYFVTVKILHRSDCRWALVAAKRIFGVHFAEMRLFRSRREMLSSYDSHRLMFPVEPKVPKYVLKDGRRGNEETGEELNEVFAYNMLSNIYAAASEKVDSPQIFNLCATVTRIVSEVSKAFAFNKSKWKVIQRGGESFVFPVISRRNLINLTALIIRVFSTVSGGGQCEAEVIPGEEYAVIEYRTKMAASPVTFKGDFVFPLIGEMYPGCKTTAGVIVFICSLFGVGCYSRITDDRTLVLRLVFSREEIYIEYSVKHLHRFDMAGCREAISLIRLLEGDERRE